jgi:glycosyltransferase involved in cell wall biosynthesis
MKKNYPNFTVLIAVYAGDTKHRFLNAIESIYSNTVLPSDLILVVDGPTEDELKDTIIFLRKKYNFTVLWLPNNLGLANALNKGLTLVKTDWVIRADSDDINVFDRFETQLKMMTNEFDLIGGFIKEVDALGNIQQIRNVPKTGVEILNSIKYRCPFNHMTVAFRTQMVLDSGGYPNIYLKQDYCLWINMLSKGARAANTEKVLVNAFAGNAMHKRRGGVKYALSEIKLQKIMVQKGFNNIFFASIIGLMRASVFLMPNFIRSYIYDKFLRV